MLRFSHANVQNCFRGIVNFYIHERNTQCLITSLSALSLRSPRPKIHRAIVIPLLRFIFIPVRLSLLVNVFTLFSVAARGRKNHGALHHGLYSWNGLYPGPDNPFASERKIISPLSELRSSWRLSKLVKLFNIAKRQTNRINTASKSVCPFAAKMPD